MSTGHTVLHTVCSNSKCKKIFLSPKLFISEFLVFKIPVLQLPAKENYLQHMANHYPT